MIRLRHGFAGIVLAGTASAAQAAVFCVGTVDALRAALAEAGGNGQDDVVQLREGEYAVDQMLDYTGTDGHDLTLTGGYRAPIGGGACLRVNYDPAGTVLDGQGTGPILRLLATSAGGDLVLRGLSFRNGIASDSFHAVGVFGGAGWTGGLLVEQNRFEHLTGSGQARRAVHLGTGTDRLIVRSNVFFDNVGGAANATPIVLFNASAQRAWVHHNTVTGNRTPDEHPHSIGGLGLDGGSADWSLANNIVWGNSGRDLHAQGTMLLRHNVFGVLTGTPETGSSGNQSIDPGFAGADDLRLRGNSPLRDNGAILDVEEGGSRDAWGGVRVHNYAADIGAFEIQESIFADGFQ